MYNDNFEWFPNSCSFNTHAPNEWINECLTTPQHKNKSAIGCQTNGIYIKRFKKYCINEKFIRL